MRYRCVDAQKAAGFPVAAAYQAAGFDEVTLTPRSADGGRDVIAVRRGRYSVRLLDQQLLVIPLQFRNLPLYCP